MLGAASFGIFGLASLYFEHQFNLDKQGRSHGMHDISGGDGTDYVYTYDRSVTAAQTFNIAVSAVNDPPIFSKGPDMTVNEDAGSQTIAGWSLGISAGPSDESNQALSFVVTSNNSGLFGTTQTSGLLK